MKHRQVQFSISGDAKIYIYQLIVRLHGASMTQVDKIDLEFIPPLVKNGVRRGYLSKEALKEVGNGWSNYIILYMIK